MMVLRIVLGRMIQCLVVFGLAFTRILFASDVHGSDSVWKKFIRGGQFYKANVVVMGGDLTGKAVVTVTADADGSYHAEFQKQRHDMKSKEELMRFDEVVRRTGSYIYVASKGEMENLAENKAESERILEEITRTRLREWVEYADANATCPVYVNTGNDDELFVDEELAKSKKIVQPEDKVVMVDPKHEMISAGFANITPWNCPRDLTEDEIARRIEKKISMLTDAPNSIFNFHCPPVDSGLDTCVKLDASVFPPKPMMDGGGLVFFGAGSTAIRGAI
jgi:Icc-related predicted phosphoesterase